MPRPVASFRRSTLACNPVLLLVVILLVTLSGCGLLGGSAQDSSGQSRTGLEKARIKITVLTTMDVAPLHLAIKNGYFQAEGLGVELIVARSGSDSLNQVISGQVDFAFASYTPFILAHVKRVADLKLVADATAAAEKNSMVVTLKNSPVRNIRDMAGKRVAVVARNTMAHLLVLAALEANNVDHNTVRWIELPFPDTPAALDRGDVDAAFLTEPFLTKAQKDIGAEPVFDTAAGPTASIPLTGYGALKTFVDANPNTVAAFQRVMQKATDEAKTDRSRIEPLLVEFANVDPQTAKLAALTDFQSGLEPKRIQRVADLMQHFGVINENFNVTQMIVPPAPTG